MLYILNIWYVLGIIIVKQPWVIAEQEYANTTSKMISIF